MEPLLGEGLSPRLDCDWVRQVLWIHDSRIASTRQDELAAGPRTIPYSHYDEKQREEAIIYFQVSGKTIDEVKAFLTKDGHGELLHQKDTSACLAG